MILAQTTNALPDNAGYVAAAYLVFLALVLIYVVIMASKLARFERELTELNETRRRAGRASARRRIRAGRAEPEEAAGDERAARARHLAQDRAGRDARAPGARRARGRARCCAS